jgi:hypothetical protein
MNTRINTCLCCSGPLLRHARHGGVYWFCSHCRQEVPIFDSSVLLQSDGLSVPLMHQLGQQSRSMQTVKL